MTTEPEAEELREPPAIVFAPEGPPVSVFGRLWPYKYVVAIVYVSALFLDILDTTIVNVAIPTLGEEFQTEPSSGSCSATRCQPRRVDPGPAGWATGSAPSASSCSPSHLHRRLAAVPLR